MEGKAKGREEESSVNTKLPLQLLLPGLPSPTNLSGTETISQLSKSLPPSGGRRIQLALGVGLATRSPM